MNLLVFSLLLATRQTAQIPKPHPPSILDLQQKWEIDGVLLVTGDTKEVKRARKTDLLNDTVVARVFPADRYEIVAWKNVYRLVIDRKTGPLGRIADRTLLASAFGKGADGILDVGRMSPELYGAAKAMAIEWPSYGQPSRRREPEALGIEVDHRIVLKSGTGSYGFNYRTSDSHLESMLSTLNRRAARPLLSAPSGRKADDHVGETASRDEFDFAYLGVRDRDRSEGLRFAAEAISKLEAHMQIEADVAVQSLLRNLGYRIDPNQPGASEMSRMSREMRNQIVDQLRNGWQEMGFGSQAEAMDLLSHANSFEIHTTLSLYQSLDAGDPSHGIPSAGIGWQIQDLLGAYLP